MKLNKSDYVIIGIFVIAIIFTTLIFFNPFKGGCEEYNDLEGNKCDRVETRPEGTWCCFDITEVCIQTEVICVGYD